MPGRRSVKSDGKAMTQAAQDVHAAHASQSHKPSQNARQNTEMPAAFGTEMILGQIETGIIVADPRGQLRYANAFAATLFRLPEDVQYMSWMTLRSLGFEDDDVAKVLNMERQFRLGRGWEGTLAVRRQDGSVFFVRANAAPGAIGPGASGASGPGASGACGPGASGACCPRTSGFWMR